jgi:hypothetical protein
MANGVTRTAESGAKVDYGIANETSLSVSFYLMTISGTLGCLVLGSRSEFETSLIRDRNATPSTKSLAMKAWYKSPNIVHALNNFIKTRVNNE